MACSDEGKSSHTRTLFCTDKIIIIRLQNFIHFVAATNIVIGYSISTNDPARYMHHYQEYRKTLRQLIPDYSFKPNHHFAMHNAEMLSYWGPLPELGEFGGEQMNGILQRISTNHHHCMLFYLF